MALVLPPTEVFVHPPAPLVKTQGGYGAYDWLRDECPTEESGGGLFAYYNSEPYPRKGHVYPESVEANNILKRLTAGSFISLAVPQAVLPGIGFLLLPWKWKIKWLEKILSNYCRLGDYINRNHYMKRRFYTKFSKELWNAVYLFLRKLGISADIAYRCGRILAHMLEIEDAYRARVQDVLTEASKDALINSPRQEISRLAQIYISREKEGLDEKFLALPKLVSLMLRFPRLKKIFVETMRQTNLEHLKMDEIDRYYILNRTGYDYLGRNIESRFKEYQKIHNNFVFGKLAESITDPEALERAKKQLTDLGFTT